MADRNAFYQAIWAAPDDDLPRMVFADWLDEHDDPDAAAFLRLLCACRTCPPDVDQLRPLVARLRRTMVKLPPEFIESACPVHPAVVIGPWVDVDHEANRRVLKLVEKCRKEWRRAKATEKAITHRLPQLNLSDFLFVDLVWDGLLPALTPAASCAIDDVPALVDVWSGVVMVVALSSDSCHFRIPTKSNARDLLLSSHTGQEGLPGWAYVEDLPIGPLGSLDDYIRNFEYPIEREWLRKAATEFDPANRPA